MMDMAALGIGVYPITSVVNLMIRKAGAGDIIATTHIITDAGAEKTNGILAMTDAQRIVILLKAIRCILDLGERDWKDRVRLQLIKSVLGEAVKKCGEECEEMLR